MKLWERLLHTLGQPFPNTKLLRDELGLVAHPEGGAFKRIFRDPRQTETPNGVRSMRTSILYMLEKGKYSSWHRIRSSETWYYHVGDNNVRIHSIDEDGVLSFVDLGFHDGILKLQYTVPANRWFAAELADPSRNYAVVSCSVSPGFHWRDLELGNRQELTAQFPGYSDILERLTSNTPPPTTLPINTSNPIDRMDRPITRIVILVAMRSEAEKIIETLDLTQMKNTRTKPKLRLQTYKGKIEGYQIHLVCNGVDPTHGVDRIGSVPAALAACDIADVFEPDLIISAGTAGGYAERGAEVGDVCIATESVYHDRRIPLNDFEKYGRGNYSCLKIPGIVKQLNLKTGVVSTGNSFDVSTADQKELNLSRATAKEMEFAGIAETVQLYEDIHILGIKAITNLVGITANAADQFKQNFEIATTNLANVLPMIIRSILNSTPRMLAASPAGRLKRPSSLSLTPPSSMSLSQESESGSSSTPDLSQTSSIFSPMSVSDIDSPEPENYDHLYENEVQTKAKRYKM